MTNEYNYSYENNNEENDIVIYNQKIKKTKKSHKNKIIKQLPKRIKLKKNKNQKNKNNKLTSDKYSNYQDDKLIDLSFINGQNNKTNYNFIKFDKYDVKTEMNTSLKIQEELDVSKIISYYPKKRKLFGEWINSEKYDLDVSNCKNSFIKKFSSVLECISYFSKNPPKFLSHLVMLIKNEVAYFGQLIINQSIINYQTYQLFYLDYEKFVKILTKDFNEKNLNKKLDDLFIEFQAKNEGHLKDHNKKVIQYIRNNPQNELVANEYLDLNFYEIFHKFNELQLDNYKIEIKKMLELEYTNKSLSVEIIETKIKAFINIIDIICINHKDYFNLIDERKNRV